MSEFAKIFAVLLCVICFGLPASATVYTVTKTADTNDGTCDADCSLREAVAAANASADNDSIEFSGLFGSAQTITLAGGELVVANNGSLTINGPGPNLLTISGNNASRILASSPNAVVNLNNLRFTGGNGAGAVNTGRGGAIYNVGGTMVITNSILTGNSAANGGALNNAASTAPSVPAVLTIVGCAITGNSSTSSGAALQNFSTSTIHIRNTTVAGNTSAGTGIASAFQANGTVTVTNSTFSGNVSAAGTGGGIYFNGSSLILTNSTIANNASGVGGGGLHRTGTNPTVLVRNTIVANNVGAAATLDVFGLVSSQGNNIVGSVGASTGWIASDLQNVDPLLGPLGDNGGLGNTYLPSMSSPAIDGGQNCVVDLSCAAGNPPVAVTADQRGVARPANALVDIGAVEVASAAFATISGQVVSPAGIPIRNAIVTIGNAGGIVDAARTNSFGFFKLGNIPTGQVYALGATAKQYVFAPQNINVSGDISGVVITATAGNVNEPK